MARLDESRFALGRAQIGARGFGVAPHTHNYTYTRIYIYIYVYTHPLKKAK